MSVRRPVVIGNWKMNGSLPFISGIMADLLDEPYGELDVYICPPVVYLDLCDRLAHGSPIQLGAQNCSDKRNGAFTGEVSPLMIKDLGCNLVLVGHSERRQMFGETNKRCAKKLKAVVDAGMTPVLCIGETLEERNEHLTLKVVKEQLESVIELDGIKLFENAMIGYEPVWAIGTGLSANADQVQEVHAAIRETLSQYDAKIAQEIRILYGGSVNPDNVEELFALEDVDGGLVGGASLHAENFKLICRAASSS